MCAVVSKQTQGNVESLEGLRRQISQLQADTSDGLKKNVYKHYHQFIETAKEISSESAHSLTIFTVHPHCSQCRVL